MGGILGSVGVGLHTPNRGVRYSDHHDRIQDIEPIPVAPDCPGPTAIRAGRAYSPNLNLIERLWKFLRKKALNRWLKTFEEMQAAVAGVLDRLGDYRDELSTLMTERFAIVEVERSVA
jgi:hypothetical protein